MKISLEKIYQCEHCGKKMRSAGAMSRHEKYCPSAPNNKHICFEFCKHLKKTTELVSTNDYDGPTYKTVFTCEALNKKMYSYILEKKYPQHIGTLERMPLDCNRFLSMSYDEMINGTDL